MNTGTTKRRQEDSTDNASSVDAGTPIYVFNGVVPSNPLITILEEKLEPFIFHSFDSVCI